jgi:hypothetical protein
MKPILEQLLKDAEQAHADYERDTLGGKRDADWAKWYAAYMAERLGLEGYTLYRP